METVKQLLERKGHQVYGIEGEATVPRAALAMHDNAVGSLVVYDQGRVVGVFTWHDLIRAVATHSGDLASHAVSEFMSSSVITTTEDMSCSDVEATMVKNHVRHLPVLRGHEVVGVVDLIDIMRRRLTEANQMTQQLEAYLREPYPA